MYIASVPQANTGVFLRKQSAWQRNVENVFLVSGFLVIVLFYIYCLLSLQGFIM